MKVRNQMSKLRLFTILFVVLGVIFVSSGISNENSTLTTLGFLCIGALLVIRILRFLYRD